MVAAFLAAGVVGGCSTAPAPASEPTTIAEYVVPSAEVSLVSTVEGRIDGYRGGAIEPMALQASLVGGGGLVAPDGVIRPNRPWIPTSIDALGTIAASLPPAPVLDDASIPLLDVCGEPLGVSEVSLLLVHEGALTEGGVVPVEQYMRLLHEPDSAPIPGGTPLFPDPSVLVMYGFAGAEQDATCTDPTFDLIPGGPYVFDVDVAVRPGWNVLTWVMRSEDGDLHLYLRTGAPGLPVPWIEFDLF